MNMIIRVLRYPANTPLFPRAYPVIKLIPQHVEMMLSVIFIPFIKFDININSIIKKTNVFMPVISIPLCDAKLNIIKIQVQYEKRIKKR